LNPEEIKEHEKKLKSEAVRVIDEGAKRNLHLRLLGAIAFQTRCPKFSFLTQRLNRVLSDVDFAGYGSESKQISTMMRELGYKDEPMITALWGDKRTIWDNQDNGVHVDIFFDKLEMNHDISFKDRLGIHNVTIPLEEMLLEKMQIVHLEEKDIVDTTMLLREHDIGESNLETVNAQYIARLLANEWGFYYTCTTNLKKVKDKLGNYQELKQSDRDDVSAKIEKLTQVIEAQPKSLAWKMRAKVGPSKKWYRDVEEVRR
jgi:hypothetical protein